MVSDSLSVTADVRPGDERGPGSGGRGGRLDLKFGFEVGGRLLKLGSDDAGNNFLRLAVFSSDPRRSSIAIELPFRSFLGGLIGSP